MCRLPIIFGAGLENFAIQRGDIMFNRVNEGAWFTIPSGSNSLVLAG
jgi:hypothetical protein